MKAIIKSISRRIHLSALCYIPVLPTVCNAIMVHVGVRDQGVLYEGKGIVIMVSDFFLILTIIGVAIWLYALINHLKGTSEKIIRKPYIIKLGMYSKDEICSLLNKKLVFNTVAEDCMYASESSFRYDLSIIDWRTFVFLFDEENQADGIDIAENYVKKVNELTRFKPAGRSRTIIFTQRIQLFIYNNVPQAVLDKAQESVYFDNIQNDILTNFIIDLSEGVLYIPCLCTRSNVGLTHIPYLIAIKKVGKYLDLI